jgi:GH15 family glucan-1,4-alpha-glucosidase
MGAVSISDHAIIGDGRTAALCSGDGSIDWLCAPRFDSPPLFGLLIDPASGGCFSIHPESVRRTSHRYYEGSALLETTWETETGTVRLTDGMVLDVSSSLLPQMMLVRHLRTEGGDVPLRVVFDPRRGIPGALPRVELRPRSTRCSWGALVLSLGTAPLLPVVPGKEHRLILQPSQDLTFVLSLADREPVIDVSAAASLAALESTDRWWRTWSEGVRYIGSSREEVVRSLITLRLLTFTPSGAPVAAPTTSLPEAIGGSRNWDYRFAWPRDASLGIASFVAVGKPEEAHSFMHWLLHASRLSRPRLEVLYTIDGRPGPPEVELRDVDGYRDSRPARIGNAASRQHQLDVYGWVLEGASRLAEARGRLHAATFRAMAGFADYVTDHHREPDSGIWESRGEPRHHVHSKVMAWVALDRASRLGGMHSVRRARLERWRAARNALAAEIPGRGFDEELGSYVRSYGVTDLDASLLTLAGLGFDSESRHRIVGTVDAIRRELSAGGPLLYRYPPDSDGLEGTEGAFTSCSFWLVEALASLDLVDDARAVFEDMCRRGTDLGLFAEEIDAATGEQLGNFPQALTHSALVQAAVALEAAERRRSGSRTA